MTPAPVDGTGGRHYIWGGGCDGWHLLEAPDLSVIRERVPPGYGETPHVHARARQYFHILSGRAIMEFADGDVPLQAGQGLHVAPGVAHRFVNRSDDEVVFLVISAPPTAGDRIELPAAGWRDTGDSQAVSPAPSGSG